MQSYSNLRVTGHAREVIRETYRFTADFPRAEQFRLTAQMRRASISAALNIVEGCSRRSSRDFVRFLEIAVGSAMELEFTLLIADDLRFGAEARNRDLFALNKVLQKELAALIRAIRARAKTGDRE